MHRRNLERRGYTLSEMLVAAAIGLAVALMVGWFFNTSLSAYARVSVRRDMQVAATTTLGRMAAELRASSLRTLTIASASGTQPPLLAFRVQRAEGTAATAFTPAAEFVVYFLDSQGRWVRKTWSNGAGGLSFTPDPLISGQRLTVAQAWRVTTTPNGSERPLVQGVTALTLSPSSFPAADMVDTIGLRMTVRKALDGETVSDTFATRVAMRNP